MDICLAAHIFYFYSTLKLVQMSHSKVFMHRKAHKYPKESLTRLKS